MNDQRPLIYGESISDLMPALIKVHDSMDRTSDGRYRFSFSLPSQEAAPLARAVKRAEAEILLEEADRFPDGEETEPGGRTAAAFIRLVTSLPAAAGRPS